MALDKNDHDMLIEVSTKQQMIWDQMMILHNSHIKEDAAEFSAIKTILTAAHKRLDGFRDFKNQIIGSIALGSFVITAGIAIAALILKKG